MSFELVMGIIRDALRNNLADPRGRPLEATDHFTGDGGTTAFTLASKRLKNIRRVTVGGAVKYERVDFSAVYDDPGDNASRPQVVFFQPPPAGAAIVCTYNYGPTWIYPDFPLVDTLLPRISITQGASRGEAPAGLGMALGDNQRGSLYRHTVDISIWVNNGDVFTINGRRLGGAHLCDYLAGRVREVLLAQRRLMKLRGLVDLYEEGSGEVREEVSGPGKASMVLIRKQLLYEALLEVRI